MFYRKTKITLMSLLLLLGINSIVFSAQSSSKKQVINIKSDTLLLDEASGLSTYKGDVLFTKEGIVIKADSITLNYEKQELTKAIMKGSPVDVQHQPDNEEKVHSQADEMEFFVNEDRLVLKGNAFVNQSSRHFSGEVIEYDTRQRIFTAAANKDENLTNKSPENELPHSPAGRVHVIIGPDEESNSLNDE